MDRRKISIIASAILFAGMGVYGCDEGSSGRGECEGDNCGGGIIVAPDSCFDVSSCKSASECESGDGKLACDCLTNESVCHSNLKCVGLKSSDDSVSCNYKCGEAGTCDYAACANTSACSVAPDKCEQEVLKEQTKDSDGDGIRNNIEQGCAAKGNEYDPCNRDMDGDTIPDGMEDLNQDCVFQPEFGETDPKVADTVDADYEKVMQARKAVCDLEKMKGKSSSPAGFKFSYAIPSGGLEFEQIGTSSDGGGQTVTFSAKEGNSVKIVGLHQLLNFSASGNVFLKEALDSVGVPFIQESKFESQVPAQTWKTNGIYDSTKLQVVADHNVDRYKYRLTIGTVSLEAVLGALAGKADLGGTGSTTWDSSTAMLYMARSYEWQGVDGSNIYSVGIACTDSLVNSGSPTSLLMDDIISGTLVVADTRLRVDKTFVCQSEAYASSSGSVDFIWVIDNSGSMEDELDHVEATVDRFVDRLDNAEFNFRLMVTATDSYTLDEWPSEGYQPASNSENYFTPIQSGSNLNMVDGYYEPTGLINTDKNEYSTAVASRCAIDKESIMGASIHFKKKVSKFKHCNSSPVPEKNICGYGLEDGLKSGLEVLKRMAADDADHAMLDQNNVDVYAQKMKFICKTDEASCTKIDKCMLHDDALKYFIFVTDEESRQFKENGELVKDDTISTDKANSQGLITTKSALKTCKTGYKLEESEGGFSMRIGPVDLQNDTDDACNPALKTADLSSAAEPEGTRLKADDSLEDLQRKNPEYYKLLMYYMESYRKFAGEGGIAAFALVGDSYEDGGRCGKLTLCKDKCIINNQIVDTELGCQLCKKQGEGDNYASWEDGVQQDNPNATRGANYGLSYIHFARLLSTLDGADNTGKAGGYGSICNDTFEGTVEEIFKDVQGRLSSHPLKGYPVSSTIRVSITRGATAIELQRGAETNGWDYDASQNAVVFNGVDVQEDDYIAIAYNIWEKIGA